MSVGSGDLAYVALHPDKINLNQSGELTQFSIIERTLDYAPASKTGLRMRIKLKRKITSEMMTTYFPSLLLMMITYATTFFKPFFFEAALSVNLTTMLVMTTIFISKMEGLPPTSDIKMIDIWLILCQLVPFAQVVLLTAKEYLREEEKEHIEMGTECEDPQVAGGKAEAQDKEGNEPKPQEAWVPMNTEPVTAKMMQKLLIIGMVLNHF